MLSKIQSSLAKLLAPGERLLIGVSGGSDSVALLDALVQSGWRPHVCHLNHKLRGAESDADAEFVRDLARRYELAVTIAERDVAAMAAQEKVSLEDAARHARHGFFSDAARRTGVHKLALAHTADDQVETLLLRLLRGTGAPGLVGIWPERQIGVLRVVRPMLGVRRTEVLEYLRAQGLKFREDSSNSDVRFTRNRVRHELLPLLEREFNPAIREVLLRTAEILRDEDSYLTRHVMEAFYSTVCRDDVVNVKALADYPVAVQRRLLRSWLGAEDGNGPHFAFEQIEAIRELAQSESPSAQLDLPDDLVVYREYEELKKARRADLEPVQGRWQLNLEGETVIRELEVTMVCHPEPVEGSQDGKAGALRFAQGGKQSECFDADTLGTAPSIRTWQEGDRFQPLGMHEEKKLQDFFVDEKIPRLQRGRVPLVCASDGRIAWVVGHRLADPFKVTDTTRRVLRLRMKSGC
jgi:tRNA(Ile)-lysidine synthase